LASSATFSFSSLLQAIEEKIDERITGDVRLYPLPLRRLSLSLSLQIPLLLPWCHEWCGSNSRGQTHISFRTQTRSLATEAAAACSPKCSTPSRPRSTKTSSTLYLHFAPGTQRTCPHPSPSHRVRTPPPQENVSSVYPSAANMRIRHAHAQS
jgi:hypothetical protein